MNALASLRTSRWLPVMLALVGGGVYFGQSWGYVHSQASVLDEGLYLYKGFLFASGEYRPFQDFGPWTNHMPLSFLIPGYVQLVFGAGLRTGRYFAAALGMLSLLGLWVAVRRGAGGGRRADWWGVFAVWAAALNPALIKMYSVQTSQGLAACMLIWVFALIVGEGRPRWQVLLGAALAGAVPLTRINLTPVLPFALAYIFAAHGRRVGGWAAAAGLVVFLAGHAWYWPGILRMWAPYFPAEMTPFLDAFRRPPGTVSLWRPAVDLNGRVLSFLQGVRFHAVYLWGVLGLLVFWPRRESRQGHPAFRTAAAGLGLFGVLLLAHGQAALGNDYCVFCFPVYLSFFSLTGLVLLATSYPLWEAGRRGGWVMPGLVLLLGAAIGYGASDTLGAALVDQRTVRQVLLVEVPRTGGSGTIPLWGLIENRFGFSYEESIRGGRYWGRVGVSGLLGLLGGALVLGYARYGRFFGRLPEGAPYGWRVFHAALAAFFLLSPTLALGGGYQGYDCGEGVIEAYEAAGERLAAVIEPGERVYWGASVSPVLLLYLPGIEIFPAQLNGVYSFRAGGNAEALERFGLWSQELAERWAVEADVVLLDRNAMGNQALEWLEAMVRGNGFAPPVAAGQVHPCEAGSEVFAFRRLEGGPDSSRFWRHLGLYYGQRRSW